MCLPFEEIEGYLHYYARKFQNNRFEHNELVNEAWIRIYLLDKIEFASQGIRWAMMTYKARQRMQDHRGSTQSKIRSIDEAITETLFFKNILVAPMDRQKRDFEDKEHAQHLLRNPRLTLADRLLIDQRYYQGLSMVKIGKIHGCTKTNIRYKLIKIANKLREIAGAA